MVDLSEIKKLYDMMSAANIPMTSTIVEGSDPHGRIDVTSKDGAKHYADAVVNRFIKENEKGLLEIRGGVTEAERHRWSDCIDDICLDCLTAEEVFKRFKYCYENDTSNYKVENLDK